MRRRLCEVLVLLAACLLASCWLPAESAEPSQLADAAGAADTSDTSDTADTSDTSDATDTSDAANSADAADTSDAANSADAADTSDAGCAPDATRGAWMYRHPGNALGTDVIVGDIAEETTALANLQAHQIDRVYGNYGDRPTTQPAVIRAWNAQLDNAGIDSQVLLGDGADIFPGCREDLLARIEDRLIDFNATATPAEQFDALHLDIEPHQYKQGASFPTTTSCGLRVPDWPFWDDLDDGGRAERYKMLVDTFSDVRAHLDSYGHTNTAIYVDLAPWVDSSASFDWTATPTIADGADWLNQVASHVDGMTMMTYERDSAASIESSVSGESALAIDVRVSVNARERAPLSTITTWTDLNDMFGVVEQLEQTHCGALPVDLFNYRYLYE